MAAQHHARPVDRAEKLRAAGDLAGAVALLDAHLTTSPDDLGAARLLAQTLYWLGDWTRARAAYEAARKRHPNDDGLRVEYGRMLAETGDRTGARRALSPLPTEPQLRGDALTLLGTLEYWSGDLATAVVLFEQALQSNPTQAEAQRSLREVRVSTAAWIRVSPTFWHDDQPLDRGTASLEAGWFVTPVTSLRTRVQPARASSRDRAQTSWSVDGELRHYIPGLRLETELAAGGVRKSMETGRVTNWTGRALLGIRLPEGVTLRVRSDRSPYVSTVSSLDVDVVVRSIAGELYWNHPRGWLGQVVVQQQAYPDNNIVDTSYAWLLAPIVRHRMVDVQAGYAFAIDDARESRFVPASRGAAHGSNTPLVNPPGRYDPYYTPAEVEKHEVAAAVNLRPDARATIRLSGSRSFHASEDAPILVDDGRRVQTVFVRRDFSAWNARAALEFRTSDPLSITATAESGHGAFYRSLNIGIAATYRFVPAAPSAPGPAR